MKGLLKIDIYQDGRHAGTLRVKDRWMGIIPIDTNELIAEIEERLPTLKGTKYNISFA